MMLRRRSSNPINGGSIYIGTLNLNPVTNPIAVYWDEAGTIPVAQPVSISGGYPMRSGTPARIYTAAIDFSMSLFDSKNALVFYEASVTSTGTLSAGNGASLVGYQSQSAGAILGTLADRIYDLNAVADFGADPTGVADSTTALAAFFNAMTDNMVAIIPPGVYKYTPVLGLGMGVGYLNMVSLANCHLYGHGAIIRNSAAVTTAPATSGTLYGVKMQACTDCSIRGLEFDGNRDTTFGTNGDGNEFYSGFYIYGCTRSRLIDCIGVNCQGDGVSTNRIGAATTFNNDCAIIGGYYGGNRRNEISVGGDYGMTIDGGVVLVGSSDAHRTNPKAGIDLEWEHATVGPTGNDTRTYIGSVSCSGTMAGGGIYMPRASGITVGAGFRAYGLLGASINIDNTATGSYETQNITIGACHLDSVYGIGITGGANISIKGTKIKATYPIIVNSPLSSAPYQWVVDIDDCHIEGESVFAVQVLQGRTKFTNNMCVNCSSGGGDNYMGLFRPLCEVRGNTFTRDSNQTAPTYGLIFSTTGSIDEDNSIRSTGSNVAHPRSYGENSVAAYPSSRTNYYNGSLLADLMSTQVITSQVVDCSSATPVLAYIPQHSEIIDLQWCVQGAGSNVVSTTTLSIGTVASAGAYVNAKTVDIYAVDGVPANITGSLVTGNTTNSTGIFITPTPGNNNPKLQLAFTTRYNRAELYTSSVLFA